MSLVLDLADAVRAGGLTVHEVGDWRRHHHGPFAVPRPTAIVCHHTGSSGAGAEGVVARGRPGLDGPLAQLSLRRDGTVGVLSAGQAWHAGTGSWPSIGRNNANSRALGIEAVYNGADITDAQRRAYPRLCAALCRRYGIAPGNVIGHREWAPGRKVDPGRIDMAVFRREVAALLAGGPAPAPPVTPSGRPVLREGMTGSVVGSVQVFANRVFASYAGIPVLPTPIFGPKTLAWCREFQRREGIDDDGVIGRTTWGRLERHGYR